MTKYLYINQLKSKMKVGKKYLSRTITLAVMTPTDLKIIKAYWQTQYVSAKDKMLRFASIG